MPELPDLVTIRAALAERLEGETIQGATVHKPLIVRSLGGEPFAEFLQGRRIAEVGTHGPFVVFTLDEDRRIIVHPMLAGRFSFDGELRRALCAELKTDAGTLGYHDDKMMGKIYLARSDQATSIPKYADQGVDLLSERFTFEEFQRRMGRNRRQVRVFLMDQSQLSAIGNAYADEILFAARIHPKTFCNKLDEDARQRLFDSIRSVLEWGIENVRAAGAPLYEKVRGHMRVRNRRGEPCTVCGTKIRRENVRGMDTFFCPQCQLPTRDGFIDWSRAPK